jgi:hypothetical protein
MNLRNIVVAAALALPLSTAPASAQFLTFVSAAGNDANTCFVQANPCRTLQRAINQTSAGGEVRLLTSLAGSGFINKSITIEGGYNTVIGIIVVNNASAIVHFRRLNLNGRHALADGFNLINAAAVHIEESSVERYTDDGIQLAAGVSTELFISDSVIRDNGQRGIEAAAGPARIVIEESRFENNAVDGLSLAAEQLSISRSTLFGNSIALQTFPGFVAGSATEVTAVGNASGFRPFAGELTLESCVASGNAFDGLQPAAALARISNSVFSDNADNGIDTNEAGGNTFTLTLLNNLIAGNAVLDVEGTLTPLAPE